MTLNFVKKTMCLGGEGTPTLQFYRKGFVLNGTGAVPTWQDIILHGNTALTLVNAKADSLEYLKLFGGTEQLPETYLDTVTLSGGCEQRNLPSGYTQVEYLEVATINAYFSTGINATIDTDIGITASNVTSNSSQLLVAECGSGGDYFRIAKAGASQRVIGTLGSSTVTDNNTDGINKFTARMNKSGFYVDGSLIGTFSDIPSSLTAVGEIDIFRGVYSTSASSSIYYAYLGTRFHRAWVDDNIFLPCRRNSDNQLGIYNTKTGQFILPSGEGTFTAGADVTVPTPDTPMDIICNNGVIKVTHNLIDLNTVTNGYYYDPQGVYSTSPTSRLTNYIPIKAGQSTTVYFKSLSTTGNLNVRINIFNSNKVWQSQEVLTLAQEAADTKIITPTVNGYMRVSANYSSSAMVDWDTAKIVYGEYTVSTIDSAIGTIYTNGTQEVVTDSLGNTANAERLLAVGTYKDTQEVIAGSVTRRVGIKVLDGTEEWVASSTADLYSLDGLDGYDSAVYQNGVVLCTHFVGVLPTVSGANMPNYSLRAGGASTSSEAVRRTIYIKYVGLSSLTDFKQFLAQQYANGIPVIIIYPLATTTSEAVASQSLSKSPVTQTAGSISNLPIAITESQKTTPTPQQPLGINCNNGVVKVSPNLFNKNATYLNAFVNADTGVLTGANVGQRSFCIACKPNTTYVISGYGSSTWGAFTDNTIGTTATSRASGNNSTITTGVNDKYLIGLAYVTEKPTDYRDTLQLELGTSATPYMGYGQTYTDGTTETVEITGKNLFNANVVLSGTVNTSGGDGNSNPARARLEYLYLPTGTYTISNNGNTINQVIGASYSDNTGSNFSSIDNWAWHNLPFTFTLTSNRYVRFMVRNSNDVNLTTENIGKFQLELGSTATTYEEYFNGGTATAENLFKVGTYQDVQSVIDGGVTRNVGIKVLDGTEGWIKSTAFYTNSSLFVSDALRATHTVLCTHYQAISTDVIGVGDSNVCKIGSNATSNVFWGRIYIYADRSLYDTAEDFADYLAQQYANGTPVTILYPIQTPTTETVTPQPMNIQAGSNIVQITQASMDDLELEVKYKAGVAVTITEIQNAQLDDSVTVTIS